MRDETFKAAHPVGKGRDEAEVFAHMPLADPADGIARPVASVIVVPKFRP